MVTEKAMELGQALVDCAEFKIYQEAKAAFENDLEAVRLLRHTPRRKKRSPTRSLPSASTRNSLRRSPKSLSRCG